MCASLRDSLRACGLPLHDVRQLSVRTHKHSLNFDMQCLLHLSVRHASMMVVTQQQVTYIHICLASYGHHELHNSLSYEQCAYCHSALWNHACWTRQESSDVCWGQAALR